MKVIPLNPEISSSSGPRLRISRGPGPAFVYVLDVHEDEKQAKCVYQTVREFTMEILGSLDSENLWRYWAGLEGKVATLQQANDKIIFLSPEYTAADDDEEEDEVFVIDEIFIEAALPSQQDFLKSLQGSQYQKRSEKTEQYLSAIASMRNLAAQVCQLDDDLDRILGDPLEFVLAARRTTSVGSIQKSNCKILSDQLVSYLTDSSRSGEDLKQVLDPLKGTPFSATEELLKVLADLVEEYDTEFCNEALGALGALTPVSSYSEIMSRCLHLLAIG